MDLESSPQSPPKPEPKQRFSLKSLSLKSLSPKPIKNGYALPQWHKHTILFTVSWMTLAVTFSSTSLLPATPEISREFSTTPETLNITNAGVLLAMGFSSLIWGPLGNLVGRRVAYNVAILGLCVCSVGTACSGGLRSFAVWRVLGGLTGTSFMVSGQTVLADVYEPVVRGTAVGFFMAGSVSGPAIGPCIGGIVVTYTTWRIIYWLQFAMTAVGLIMSFLFVPSIQSEANKTKVNLDNDPDNKEVDSEKKEKTSPSLGARAFYVLSMFNPVRILRMWVLPNIFLADLTCGLLSTFQYTLLTSARSIFNPRFNLTTPLISGLFYLAPGAGFLVGSILGGKMSDRTVKKYILKRGVRLPQDRLRSGLVTLFLVLPVGALVYGWTLETGRGGMGVPVVAAFVGGMGLMGSFNGLNTYCAEAIPSKRSEVIAGKYIIQYFFSAGSSALVAPVIGRIGVGWTFTICVFFSLLGGVLVIIITRWGERMEKWALGRVSLGVELEK